jgi:hypothetical protein
MNVAIENWFSGSQEEQLARWIFLDAAAQDTLSNARFVAGCQCIEILGRLELNTTASQRRRRPTFEEILRAFMRMIPEEIRSVLAPREALFRTNLRQMRNLLVHMGENIMSMQEAQRLLPSMTYRVLALVMAHQATKLRVPVSDILRVIRNSALGRAALYRLADETLSSGEP